MGCVTKDRWLFGIMGGWSTAALDPGACYDTYAKEAGDLWPSG